MKAGNKAYFVQSLLLPAIPCRILQIEDYNGNLKDRAFVRAELADGTIVSDYLTKFTARKPELYNAHAYINENKYASVYFDRLNKKPVTLEQFKESYNHFKSQGKYKEYSDFDDYMHDLTKNGCFIPYSKYLESTDI